MRAEDERRTQELYAVLDKEAKELAYFVVRLQMNPSEYRGLNDRERAAIMAEAIKAGI